MTQTSSDNVLRVAVDIGGTFTDGVATLSPAGRIWVAKSPTTPDDPGEAITTVIQGLLRQVAADVPNAPSLAEVVHGTTLITNTLIERKGVETGLITTQGMRDVLDIGREWRYDSYDLDLELPRPLVAYEKRLEVNERMDSSGAIVVALSEDEIQRIVEGVRALGVSSVAISLLHAYVNPAHERKLAEALAKALPGVAVSLSSEVAREIKEYERTSTIVANAYVKPVVEAYLANLESRIDAFGADVPLRVMVSSGGFCSAQTGAATPIFLLESGPAAGVISALNTAKLQGIDQVLAFDMGGTTAKACVSVGGDAPVAHMFECARVARFKRGSGFPLLIPSIELIEIGAGGGSIAHKNRLGLLNVGPESSGSVPGPVCYGRGGTQPTVTDADLVLGYLNPANFLGGEMHLDKAATEAAMARLAGQLGVAPIEAAWGICNIVNENMASAARIHIAENGLDPRDLTMVATGGAGPVHAVDVARKMRVPRVLIPIAAGAGSCIGMLAAPPRADRAWSNPQVVEDVKWSEVAASLRDLRKSCEAELAEAGARKTEWLIGAEMRYQGQGTEVSVYMPYEEVNESTKDKLLAEFFALYTKLYGRLVPDAKPQVMTWRLVGREPTQAHHFAWGDDRVKTVRAAPTASRPIYLPLEGRYVEVNVYDRYALPAGQKLAGPLILEERESTIAVAVDAEVEILEDLTVSVLIKAKD